MEYLKKIYARLPSTWTSATGRRYRLGRSGGLMRVDPKPLTKYERRANRRGKWAPFYYAAVRRVLAYKELGVMA